MHQSWKTISLLSLFSTAALADHLGPTYPAPIDFSSKHSKIPAAWKNLTTLFDGYLKHHVNNSLTAPLAGVENITFSTSLFSIHDPRATELQYHYTSPEIATSKNGTNKVDANSIYRIASVSKLFTVYTGMVTLTEEEWHTPLTKLNPALAKYAAVADEDPTWLIQFDKITPWALASQSSGIPTQGGPLNDILWAFLTQQSTVNPVTEYGFPPENISSLGPCYGGLVEAIAECHDSTFVESNALRPPAFLPWSTPMYADNNYEVLGALLSNITGKPLADVYESALFSPLNLTSTFYSPPTKKADQARSVVAGIPEVGFYLDIPYTTPSGGLLSTLTDLTKFATSILNNTLLSASVTRKWMKPQTHTASLSYSIGAPWEIVRYVSPTTGKVTDIYTKLGDSGNYGSITALIPDYDAGFTLLAACSNVAVRSLQTNVILDYITSAVLPALEAQAALEAAQNYVGTYRSTQPKVNSSITIGIDESSVPTNNFGLSLTEWISNGTDVLASDLFSGAKPRLLLSIPKQTPQGESGAVAFQASTFAQTYSYLTPGAAKRGTVGPFSGQYLTNLDFWSVDGDYYGGNGYREFVFAVNGDGKAESVTPVATRSRLEKK
ncbi:uncharacterized protein TRUGW13939_07604 [Talaromyces rugulosus]|uniref:Uncharacterized protein n=1 Tax=Talaromyces rugulosus TaxID=121627 RepID=A0A7H8R260_TALRU|nr:uncharacterized protein TRUGW13939_07604 [Talaromyces rugulosus]QKX60459.1 hypothetical protein TRUGW13939_07604 [Talaromyces rugulosus]